jgi:hypothetical protein
MNIRYLVAIAVVIVLIAVAHINRYQPLPGDPMGYQPLWDRWLHRVCFQIFVDDNRLACSVNTLTGKQIAAESSMSTVAEEVQLMRSAGFTDKEIVEHVLKPKPQ